MVLVSFNPLFHLVWVGGPVFHSFGLLGLEGQLFHLVWVCSLEGAAVFFWFGLLVWRGRLFHLVFGLFVWRGRLFYLLLLGGSSFT